MKNAFRFTVVATILLGVLGCGPKPPSAAERTAKTFLAENPVSIGPEVVDVLELVSATAGAHTDSDFVVNAKLKLKRDLDWENIFIYGDTLEGPDRQVGKADQIRVPGPKNAGDTIEITIRMDRDGVPGQRVFVIRSVDRKAKFG